MIGENVSELHDSKYFSKTTLAEWGGGGGGGGLETLSNFVVLDELCGI